MGQRGAGVRRRALYGTRLRTRRSAADLRAIAGVLVAAGLAGCAVTADKRTAGPANIPLAPGTQLQVPRSLIFIPADESLRLMRAAGERPGAEVLGAVLNHDPQRPLIMLVFATARDARGVPSVELVGWDHLAQSPLQHPSANNPPPQPPLQLSPPPLPPKNQATKDAKPQKLCLRETFVPCPDERSRSCTRKELAPCD